MRIVIAPDSFKESATAAEVADAIALGVRTVLPGAQIDCIPMADGGEGTVEALVSATSGTTETVNVTGPLGAPVSATYGILGDGRTAVIEMAAASGLALIPKAERNPRLATTYGVGELICHALDRGASKIIVGIGGSATNDAGAGMAQALGYSLRDSRNNELPRGGAALIHLATIDSTRVHPRLRDSEILVACDVRNPLCGPNGASVIYGPQKGADESAVRELDDALDHFATVVNAQLRIAVRDMPGAGAAGGLGAGLVVFAGGKLSPGLDLVADACNLAARLNGAALVITGEGRIDGQSVNGKTPVGVAHIARANGVPTIAIAGQLGPGYEAVFDHGIVQAHGLVNDSITPSYAMRHTAELLTQTAQIALQQWLDDRKSRS